MGTMHLGEKIDLQTDFFVILVLFTAIVVIVELMYM